MADFRSNGDMIDYTPASAVKAGDVVLVGSIVAVAKSDIASNEKGALAVEGIFRFDKATGSSTAIAAGAKCYWDAENEQATTVAESNKTIGYAVPKEGEDDVAAATTDATVDIKLARA